MFSVVTVVFNDHLGLEKTINSLLDNFRNVNCKLDSFVVINGSSDSKSDEVFQHYRKKIECVFSRIAYVNEPDDGIYDAMNKGVRLLPEQGFCLFLNSGDYLASNCFDTLLNQTVHFGSVDILVLPILSEDESGNAVITRGTFNASELYERPAYPHQSSFIKNSVIKKKLYNTNYRILADYDFFCSCFEDGISIKVVDNSVCDPVAIFVQGGVSNDYSKQLQFLSEFRAIRKKRFKSYFTRYEIILILKYIFLRFSLFRKSESFLRKLFVS